MPVVPLNSEPREPFRLPTETAVPVSGGARVEVPATTESLTSTLGQGEESFESSPVAEAAATPLPGAESRAAISQFREVMGRGQLKAYYDAAIGQPSSVDGDAARALFAALPQLPANARAQDFVNAGYWNHAPHGLDQVEQTPRFVKGRQVIVSTTVDNRVNVDGTRNPNFMAFRPEGPVGKTYRAEIVDEAGDFFRVKIDGSPGLLSFRKSEVFDQNAPHEFEGDLMRPGVHWGKKTADYASPFMKAKVAEVALKLQPLVEQMDFAAALREARGLERLRSLVGGPTPQEKLLTAQKAGVHHVFSSVDMLYPKPEAFRVPGRDSGQDSGRLAVRGIGMCYQQASVTAALLAPFRHALGVDVQMISGGDFSKELANPNPVNPLRAGMHGWLHVVYRPSMNLTVLDRTWNQVNLSADQAYSTAGRRYPGELVPDLQQVPPSAGDLALNGPSLSGHVREFGVEGQTGRENHIGNTQVYE